MSTHPTVPSDVIAAISVLNAHARAYGFAREAIYQYKSLAALISAVAGTANARPVATMAKCHYCSGTGLFHDWYNGPTDDPCRKCARTGRVHLRFVETTIDGHAWHHPWERQGREILSFALGRANIFYANRMLRIEREGVPPEEMIFGDLGDWKPNTPGEKLPPERAAELLNLIEDWVNQVSRINGSLHWPLKCAQIEGGKYRLNLGRLGARCHVCGSDDVRLGRGHIQKWFEWSVPVCRVHEASDDLNFPESAMTPAIAKWRARREATR